MNYLTQNIRFLRKQEHLTQQQFADRLGVKRSLIGAYEEGRAYPKIVVIQKLSEEFMLSIDELINVDLQRKCPRKKQMLQILPVVVDCDNRELIPIVPEKASAGYLSGMSDPEYIRQLPVFSMPVPELSAERTYRVFQIKGDSMLPVQPGAYVFCVYVESLSDIKDGHSYIVITKDEGIVYKHVYRSEDKCLLLVSDNKIYSPYSLKYDSVVEIWKAKGVLSFNLD